MRLLIIDTYKVKTSFSEKVIRGIKKHAILRDKQNKWTVGADINFVNRDNVEFATLECVSIQEIEIRYKVNSTEVKIWIGGVYLGGYDTETKEVNRDRLKQFVLNEGFQNVEAFFDWFQENLNGKVIHWTNLAY